MLEKRTGIVQRARAATTKTEAQIIAFDLELYHQASSKTIAKVRRILKPLLKANA